MAEITASMVRELRERTGAGMMDCKQALQETAGDFEAAVDWLRKKGLRSAEKKAARTTDEGRVFASLADDGRSGTMVNVSCETDFVARTPDFEAFLKDLVAHVADRRPQDLEELAGQEWIRGGGTVHNAIQEVIGKLGENIQVAGIAHFENPEGFVESYVHHNNKVGVLVSVTTGAEREKARETLRALCMHIAFSDPQALSREELPAEEVERERAIYAEEVADKPEQMRPKIIEGKLSRWYAERVLPEQKWIHDDKRTVEKALHEALGADARVAAFRRFSIG